MHSFDNLLSIRYNNNMKLLMDADCLIKLTKAGLKETVCQSDTVFIPAIVVREVVDDEYSTVRLLMEAIK